MFVRFTTPEGARVHIRENRVQAFVSAEDGTRVLLSGSLSILVAEERRRGATDPVGAA